MTGIDNGKNSVLGTFFDYDWKIDFSSLDGKAKSLFVEGDSVKMERAASENRCRVLLTNSNNSSGQKIIDPTKEWKTSVFRIRGDSVRAAWKKIKLKDDSCRTVVFLHPSLNDERRFEGFLTPDWMFFKCQVRKEISHIYREPGVHDGTFHSGN